MDVLDYVAPVNRLLTRGDPDEVDPLDALWPDYLALGIGPEHLPELIRLATDPQFDGLPDGAPMRWAPLHAWRAIGQLGEGAAAAVGPLLSLASRLADDEDEYAMIELPLVLSMIGLAANDPLIACLADASKSIDLRAIAAEALEGIAQMHDDEADRAATALRAQMQRFDENHPDLNALLVFHLANLNDVDSLLIVERAYAAGRVDELVAGTWAEVRESFVLAGPADDDALPDARPLKLEPPPGPHIFEAGILPAFGLGTPPVPRRSAEKSQKAKKDKRKQSKNSRKQNRRK